MSHTVCSAWEIGAVLVWAAIGLHGAWNFAEGGIFGVSVSGFEVKGLLQARVDGPGWLTGGSFGAEASVITVGLCLVAGVALLWRARARGALVVAPWVARRGAAPQGKNTSDERSSGVLSK